MIQCSSVKELMEMGQSTPCLGLADGKMGITIALFRYSRLSGDRNYEGAACKLLDEIYEQIDYLMPVSFADGLCGIGWGLEYLVQHGYVEGDTDEVLKDIDLCVVGCINASAMLTLSLQYGIVGLGRYLLIRVISTFLNGDTSSSALLKEYLIYLIDWLDTMWQQNQEVVDDLLDFLFELYPTRIYQTKVALLIKRCMANVECV